MADKLSTSVHGIFTCALEKKQIKHIFIKKKGLLCTI